MSSVIFTFRSVSEDMENKEASGLYGNVSSNLTKKSSTVVYCKEKTGKVERFFLFPGITLYLMDIFSENTDDEVVEISTPGEDIINICYCKEGRFEAEYSPGQYFYLGEGDAVIHNLVGGGMKHSFPVLRFRGAVISVRIETARAFCEKLSENPGFEFLDLRKLYEIFVKFGKAAAFKDNRSLQRLFEDIYTEEFQNKTALIKLRILEILCLLAEESEDFASYIKCFDEQRVENIKSIRKLLIENIHTKYTQNMLSEMYSIPLTALKECFKAVYGVPLNSYMREYRIKEAAALLKNTSLSVADISIKVGYANQSKFAEVFKEIMGLSPTEYRNKF